jgi:hypothetical protein
VRWKKQQKCKCQRKADLPIAVMEWEGYGGVSGCHHDTRAEAPALRGCDKVPCSSGSHRVMSFTEVDKMF